MSAAVLQAIAFRKLPSAKLPYHHRHSFDYFRGNHYLFKLPAIPGAVRHDGAGVKASLWKYRQLVFGAIGIFVYVGAEVSIGSFNQLFWTKRDRRSARVGRCEIRHLLLGRRHGRPLHRFRYSSESKNRHGARRDRHRRLPAGVHINANHWSRRNVGIIAW